MALGHKKNKFRYIKKWKYIKNNPKYKASFNLIRSIYSKNMLTMNFYRRGRMIRVYKIVVKIKSKSVFKKDFCD